MRFAGSQAGARGAHRPDRRRQLRPAGNDEDRAAGRAQGRCPVDARPGPLRFLHLPTGRNTPACRAAHTSAREASLGCAGVARSDFFLSTDGPLLNEVSTMPGFTEHSQVPKMFASAGLPHPELLDLLVSDALSGPAVPP